MAGFISLQQSHLRPGSLLQQREKLHCSDDNISYSGRRQQTMVASSPGGGGRPVDSLRPRLISHISHKIASKLIKPHCDYNPSLKIEEAHARNF